MLRRCEEVSTGEERDPRILFKARGTLSSPSKCFFSSQAFDRRLTHVQHAALTPKEVYSVQMNRLRMARGIPQKILQRHERPRRHPYSVFEDHLPTSFSAINVDSSDLATDEPESLRPHGKPDLLCVFCMKGDEAEDDAVPMTTGRRVKKKNIAAFDSLSGYWSHLRYKHENIDDSARAEEVRCTAAKWRTYWKEYSDGGKRGYVTQERIDQTEKADFDWEVVRTWHLRKG